MSSEPFLASQTLGESGRSRSLREWLVEPVSRDRETLDDISIGAGKREYYRRQREMQESMQEIEKIITQEAQRRTLGGSLTETAGDEAHTGSRLDQISVSLSNYINVGLFFAKLYASLATHSLAIIASTLDSLLDILAGAILWYTSVAMASHDPHKYPVGKRRMQPVGIMVFAAIMATLGFQVLLEGVRSLIAGPGADEEKSVPTAVLHWVLLLLACVVAIKLLLFLLCRISKNDIVQAYATDHFLDVITNAVGLLSALLGHNVAWWVDPVGAIVIALYTIINWSRTVLENAHSLVGLSAPPELLAKIIHVSLTHDPRIQKIESLRAWQLGNEYIVEVDIELPGDMRLREAHDIGESLQNKLEALPEVDRAFVHLDHDEGHEKEHAGGPILFRGSLSSLEGEIPKEKEEGDSAHLRTDGIFWE